MNRARYFWCACAAAICAVVALGDELSLEPRQGVLLLRNGELISGTIIAAGDRYDVHLEDGEINVKRSDVAMVCRDALACYLRQREGIELGRAQDHLELAQWCIKNELLEAAEKELAAARAADASHPRLRLVESRLLLAKEPPPSEPATSPPEKQAAQETLDRVARGMPAGAMENFTNTIQPMLLNYCAKGGCHAGRGAGGLKLDRIHPKQVGRSTTQRNLQRVLSLIDREDPPQSKLLMAPIRPHGSAQAAVFTDRHQSQYLQLVQWVYAVAGPGRKPAPPTLAERTAPLRQAVPGASGSDVAEPADEELDGRGPIEDRLRRPRRLRDGSQIPASSAEQAYTRAELRALGLEHHATSRVQYGADAAAEFVPKDPFDPEIFNRRFFGRKK